LSKQHVITVGVLRHSVGALVILRPYNLSQK
jgi:hypothetical protein